MPKAPTREASAADGPMSAALCWRRLSRRHCDRPVGQRHARSEPTPHADGRISFASNRDVTLGRRLLSQADPHKADVSISGLRLAGRAGHRLTAEATPGAPVVKPDPPDSVDSAVFEYRALTRSTALGRRDAPQSMLSQLSEGNHEPAPRCPPPRAPPHDRITEAILLSLLRSHHSAQPEMLDMQEVTGSSPVSPTNHRFRAHQGNLSAQSGRFC